MDPNAALQRLRELMQEIREYLDENCDEENDKQNAPVFQEFTELANEAVDVWDGLDEWMKKGGFVPSDWNSGRERK